MNIIRISILFFGSNCSPRPFPVPYNSVDLGDFDIYLALFANLTIGIEMMEEAIVNILNDLENTGKDAYVYDRR